MKDFDKSIINEEQIALARKAQAGDQLALGQLFTAYRGLLVKASQVDYDGLSHEDMYAELCLRFVEIVQRYSPERNPYLASHINKYIRWAALDYIKKFRSYRQKESVDVEDVPEPAGSEIQFSLSKEEWDALLQKMNLSRKQQQLLTLLYQGKNAREIQEQMHFGDRAYRALLKRLRENCKKSPDFLEAMTTSQIVPEGYVDRSRYAMQPSWGLEKAEIENAHWDE